MKQHNLLLAEVPFCYWWLHMSWQSSGGIRSCYGGGPAAAECMLRGTLMSRIENNRTGVLLSRTHRVTLNSSCHVVGTCFWCCVSPVLRSRLCALLNQKPQGDAAIHHLFFEKVVAGAKRCLLCRTVYSWQLWAVLCAFLAALQQLWAVKHDTAVQAHVESTCVLEVSVVMTCQVPALPMVMLFCY